jgi:hypothetical protein
LANLKARIGINIDIANKNKVKIDTIIQDNEKAAKDADDNMRAIEQRLQTLNTKITIQNQKHGNDF